MREFEVRLRSVQDVQDFVALATEQPFPVFVGNPSSNGHKVDAKCFMEMFCLDFTRPLIASAQCGEDAFERLRKAADRFLVKK